jgi:Tol biopolymer transport system component
MNNDIYVANLDKNTHTRVTFDGSATIFNGVPDWVYEGKATSFHQNALIALIYHFRACRGSVWQRVLVMVVP